MYTQKISQDNMKGIDHIAIAVKDLEAAVELYTTFFGFSVTERRTTEGQVSGMISACLERGGVKFVLVQGTNDKSNVCQFIKNYGPGIQHVAIETNNIHQIYDELKQKGVKFLTEIFTSPGLYQTFTYRDENSGLMIEIIERNDAPGNFSDKNVQLLFEARENENVY